jgi:hypothetical protein
MFAIHMLPAGHGDALVVEYGTPADPHRILIDAGTVHQWPNVRACLVKRNDARYEVFVITHVDEDHIGGAVALLDDVDLRHWVSHVWFNGFMHCANGGSVLGPVHGEMLTKRIAEGPYHWNAPFPRRGGASGPAVVPSTGELPIIDLPGNARLVLLSPSGPKLKRMAKVWQRVVEEANLVPGAGTVGKNRTPKPHTIDVTPLSPEVTRSELEALAADEPIDGSEANGSSIAFVLEFNNKRLLLGADAHPDVLTANLARYGHMVGETRPRIDLYKAAHHGSGANLSSALVEAMDCRRYLLSSNGDNFGHPDDAAVARAIVHSAGPTTFYCNYATNRTQPWVERGRAHGATFTLPKSGQSGQRVPV